MQENEFEKQVQQKMDGFKLRPGTEVWENVTATIIHQKGRRRQLILFVIFLCCFLAGSIFLSDTQTKHFFEKQVAVSTNTLTTQNSTFLKSNSDVNTNEEKTQNEIVSTNTGIQHLPQQQQQSSITQLSIAQQVAKHRSIKNTTVKNTINTSAGIIEEIAKDAVNPDEKMQQLPSESNSTYEQSLLQKKDSGSNNVIAKKIPDTLKRNLNNVSLDKKQPENKKKNRWVFGVILSAGESSTANGYLGSNANSSYYDYASAPASNGSSGNLNSASYVPSKIKSGLAFTAGLLASRKISSKSNFIIGLNYKLFNTSLAVGNDSSLNGVVRYAIGNTGRYHNKYQFIEIPLSIQTQIANIKMHPLYLNAGVSFSQLISSNALQYNISQGKYYIDNSLFHKAIFGLSAGLSFNLLNSKKASLLLGPQIYYSATTLANSGLYTKAHYSYFGIQVQKMFWKK